ncbi:MAG: glycosyl hydrolase family 8 [candidate division KSB1 bacterium]|nr:glycosyl hydrolase family 8 [candidate division KSB1 bacterium]
MRFTPAVLLVPLLGFLLASCRVRQEPISRNLPKAREGAYFTGHYPNLFVELLGKKPEEVQAKVEVAFQQLFYGDDASERVYYPVEPGMAYIKDVLHSDVRTEGMSYGMMIAVQLDRKEEFDRLWKWSKTYLQHKDGPRAGYFCWHATTDGKPLDQNSASDGEEWYTMALFFASGRWGDGEGIYDYRAEAQRILDAMLTKAESSDRPDVVTNMFNRKNKLVVFVPSGEADDWTDPSYHLPHFYELWGRWASRDNAFWCEAAVASREFLRKSVHPKTGLAPDYAYFDGRPFGGRWGGGHEHFQYDAWRVAMNVAIDYLWFAKDPWQVEQSNRLLRFFYKQGIKTYRNLFTLDGRPFGDDHSAGLVAMNAVAALAATDEIRREFVRELWELPVPSGPARYYDGMLYMLALLQVSGNFRIYDPIGRPLEACPPAGR